MSKSFGLRLIKSLPYGLLISLATFLSLILLIPLMDKYPYSEALADFLKLINFDILSIYLFIATLVFTNFIAFRSQIKYKVKRQDNIKVDEKDI